MQRILITGIGSGLGLALAQWYLQQEAEVYALGRHFPEPLQDHGKCRFQYCDLQQLERIDPAARSLLNGVQNLDLMILNAGVLGAIKDMTETPLYEIDAVMTVNVWANKVLLDTLIDLEVDIDQVVGISSGAAVNCNRGWNAYSLSKGTLNSLLKLYAREMESTHVTALAPGIIWTPMLAKVIETSDKIKFPSVQRVQDAEKMSPEEAARLLAETFPKLKAYESGSFLDVRNL
ncbi:MAG: alcohol dehydrogenase [Methylothermaceae bacteria B42]|nr:MAG: alcohol dehydrogenase [Methylothermaceae bacteria B42]HHJ40227.1 SDR family NAD(P)-dependent oxidoreductase [Methylothermaceae bacterium]